MMNETDHFSELERETLYRVVQARPMLEQLNWRQGKPLRLMHNQWSDGAC